MCVWNTISELHPYYARISETGGLYHRGDVSDAYEATPGKYFFQTKLLPICCPQVWLEFRVKCKELLGSPFSNFSDSSDETPQLFWPDRGPLATPPNLVIDTFLKRVNRGQKYHTRHEQKLLMNLTSLFLGDGLVMSYLSSAFSFIIVRDKLVEQLVCYFYFNGHRF